MSVEPFRVSIPDDALRDLRQRLAGTRWPESAAPAEAWSDGVDLAYLKQLVDYWRDSFDWRKQEALLNGLPQFRTRIEDLDIHFVHARGRGPDPLPLVMTNGWPSSFFELYKVIGPLSDPAAHGGDPADAFHVVVPSLPGYGFSARPAQPGLSPRRIAPLWVELMARLGYERFAAHGSDWGSFVSALIGYAHPERAIALHLTMAPFGPPKSQAAPANEAERQHIAESARRGQRDMAYSAIQGTRPKTLSVALNDSPAGLAAWIVDRWRLRSDCAGEIERVFTRDEILTNLSIYWFTGTAGSSTQLYWESRRDRLRLAEGERIEVPCGFAVYPQEHMPPRSRVERAFRVTGWTERPRGGHYPALEDPDGLVADLRAFFRPHRKS